LLAHPYPTDGTVAATIGRHSPRWGPVLLLVGEVDDVAAKHLLVDRPGSGAWVVDAADADLRPVDVPGSVGLHEVGIDLAGLGARPPTIGESHAEPARRRSRQLGRIALAFDILGAAEGALATATDHANAREQFGQPIARFQAVRHLLAWAATDGAALQAVAQQAVDLDHRAPPGYDEVVKALAGRNGRRACERTLQVLGAIGFTAEHRHHRFHSRVLALDALLGTSAELTRGLGARWREARADPGIPATTLSPAGRTS
jgi:Acyl-CoA dehydrogenase, C-terminal domain